MKGRTKVLRASSQANKGGETCMSCIGKTVCGTVGGMCSRYISKGVRMKTSEKLLDIPKKCRFVQFNKVLEEVIQLESCADKIKRALELVKTWGHHDKAGHIKEEIINILEGKDENGSL
jgi:hypothetical protein